MVLTGNGPILVLTTCPAACHPRLHEALARRGFEKYIACEVPLEAVRRSYGPAFEVIAANLDEERPVRVIDYDGLRVFRNVSLSDIDDPVSCDEAV
jgi:hypothetical protein